MDLAIALSHVTCVVLAVCTASIIIRRRHKAQVREIQMAFTRYQSWAHSEVSRAKLQVTQLHTELAESRQRERVAVRRLKELRTPGWADTSFEVARYDGGVAAASPSTP